MANLNRSRAHSSAGERPLHTREVRGSIPRAPTQKPLVIGYFRWASPGLSIFEQGLANCLRATPAFWLLHGRRGAILPSPSLLLFMLNSRRRSARSDRRSTARRASSSPPAAYRRAADELVGPDAELAAGDVRELAAHAGRGGRRSRRWRRRLGSCSLQSSSAPRQLPIPLRYSHWLSATHRPSPAASLSSLSPWRA